MQYKSEVLLPLYKRVSEHYINTLTLNFFFPSIQSLKSNLAVLDEVKSKVESSLKFNTSNEFKDAYLRFVNSLINFHQRTRSPEDAMAIFNERKFVVELMKVDKLDRKMTNHYIHIFERASELCAQLGDHEMSAKYYLTMVEYSTDALDACLNGNDCSSRDYGYYLLQAGYYEKAAYFYNHSVAILASPILKLSSLVHLHFIHVHHLHNTSEASKVMSQIESLLPDIANLPQYKLLINMESLKMYITYLHKLGEKCTAFQLQRYATEAVLSMGAEVNLDILPSQALLLMEALLEMKTYTEVVKIGNYIIKTFTKTNFSLSEYKDMIRIKYGIGLAKLLYGNISEGLDLIEYAVDSAIKFPKEIQLSGARLQIFCFFLALRLKYNSICFGKNLLFFPQIILYLIFVQPFDVVPYYPVDVTEYSVGSKQEISSVPEITYVKQSTFTEMASSDSFVIMLEKIILNAYQRTFVKPTVQTSKALRSLWNKVLLFIGDTLLVFRDMYPVVFGEHNIHSDAY